MAKAKIKYTKNELKKQRETLKRLVRYLPTLELKKTQLLQEIARIQSEIDTLQREISTTEQAVMKWVSLFAEDVDIFSLIEVKDINTSHDNIAGVDIPVFEDIDVQENEYDFITTPLWVDQGVAVAKEQMIRKAKIMIAEEQQRVLHEEFRKIVQRINLFEKVKIPEAKENIRVIQIYIGDQMTAGVVTGKIAKSKMDNKKRLANV